MNFIDLKLENDGLKLAIQDLMDGIFSLRYLKKNVGNFLLACLETADPRVPVADHRPPQIEAADHQPPQIEAALQLLGAAVQAAAEVGVEAGLHY